MSSNTRVVERVLQAAGLSDGEIAGRVADIGSDAVADTLLAEVASRATLLNGPSDKFVIQCDLGFGGDRLHYLLTVGDGDPRVEKGANADAAGLKRYDHSGAYTEA